MGKWYGKIGFGISTEVEKGVWVEEVVERPYYGDAFRDYRKRQNSGGINDNINIANTISIVADPFAVNNCSTMLYAEFMGSRWKVTDIQVQFPRLLLSIGGVYNGHTA